MRYCADAVIGQYALIAIYGEFCKSKNTSNPSLKIEMLVLIK